MAPLLYKIEGTFDSRSLFPYEFEGTFGSKALLNVGTTLYKRIW